MRHIGINEELLCLFTPEFSLVSSTVEKIEIVAVQYEPIICMSFRLMYPKDQILTIRFEGVLEFSFNHDDRLGFYDVSDIKFFKSEKGFYLSIDPFDGSTRVDERDNNIIICNRVEGLVG